MSTCLHVLEFNMTAANDGETRSTDIFDIRIQCRILITAIFHKNRLLAIFHPAEYVQVTKYLVVH